MNAYWVADTIPEPTGLEMIYTFLSVKFWKHFHPQIPTVLYTDIESWTYLKLIDEWDDVVFYDFKNTPIIKGTGKFWAAGKLQAMQYFTPPFCILDLDMFYTDTIQFSEPVIAAYLELGSLYYINPNHPSFVKAGIKPFSKSQNALNVSFLYIQEPEFHKMYVETSLDWMERLSNIGDAGGSFMTFCEQKLLLDLIYRDNIRFDILVKHPYHCRCNEWVGGLDNLNYFHLQMDKQRVETDAILYAKLKGKAIKKADEIDENIRIELYKFIQRL